MTVRRRYSTCGSWSTESIPGRPTTTLRASTSVIPSGRSLYVLVDAPLPLRADPILEQERIFAGDPDESRI
jgi:hypothetical protein